MPYQAFYTLAQINENSPAAWGVLGALIFVIGMLLKDRSETRKESRENTQVVMNFVNTHRAEFSSLTDRLVTGMERSVDQMTAASGAQVAALAESINKHTRSLDRVVKGGTVLDLIQRADAVGANLTPEQKERIIKSALTDSG